MAARPGGLEAGPYLHDPLGSAPYSARRYRRSAVCSHCEAPAATPRAATVHKTTKASFVEGTLGHPAATARNVIGGTGCSFSHTGNRTTEGSLDEITDGSVALSL